MGDHVEYTARYFQGRVVARTRQLAIKKIVRQLEAQGYRPATRSLRCYPCPVQPYRGVVWWEWQVAILPKEG